MSRNKLVCPPRDQPNNHGFTHHHTSHPIINISKNHSNTNSDLLEDETFPICFKDVSVPIQDAHYDDIHGMVWMQPRQFVSGSKDNTLKVWGINNIGEITFDSRLRNAGNYTSWITALGKVNDEELIFGTRDGKLSMISTSKDVNCSLELDECQKQNQTGVSYNNHGYQNRNKNGSICKTRNQSRVTTLYALSNFEPHLSSYVMVGRPKELLCVDISDPMAGFEIKWKENLHSNDWVYCVLPIISMNYETFRACIVMGSSLTICSINLSDDEHTENWSSVWSEDRKSVKHGNDRAHIADLQRLSLTNNNWISGSCFDGVIRIFDIERSCLNQELVGERQRCWQTLEYDANQLLSTADDGYLNLWDIRTSTVQGKCKHNGRVSCTLLDKNTKYIITASCPNDVKHNKSEKGTFRVLDLRKLDSSSFIETVNISNKNDENICREVTSNQTNALKLNNVDEENVISNNKDDSKSDWIPIQNKYKKNNNNNDNKKSSFINTSYQNRKIKW
eukprot:gene7938-10771_t